MKRPLDRYAEKRAFTRTPEPAPKLPTDRRGPLLFVIQKHAARRLHYDFRLELDGVLKSWAVPKGPSLEYGDKRLAVEVEDHPFDYGSFEGVIPAKEYGAGNVIVWDCGVYSPDEDRRYSFGNREEAEERVRTELAQGKLSFFLRGEKLKGSFALVRTSSDKQWLLLKHKDRFANSSGTDVLARSRSVLSGRSLDELASVNGAKRLEAAALGPSGAQEAMPKKLDPMLAEIGETARSDQQWLYEPKVDGYRVIAFVQDGTVRLQSRGGIDLTVAFPEIVADLAAQAVDSMIVDGEIVALDASGQPSFNALQNRRELKTPHEVAAAQREAPVILLCFDLLHFAGTNLRGAPYIDRRRYLSQCLLPSAHLQLVHVSDDAEKLYAASLAAGFEGIVAKRKDSTYQPGKRSGAWLKFKSTQTAEFVVGGYTQGKGAREALGSLLLGYFSGSKLHFAGHVGSGLNDKLVADLSKRFTKLERKAQPFVEKPPLHRPTTWLDPEVVVEVSFSDWTPDGMLRAPVFQRVREDIEPKTVKNGPKSKRPKPAKLATAPNEVAAVLQQLENKSNRIDLEVGGARIRLTNLDRVYWPANPDLKQPALTKRDLVRYLASVSKYMLPHLRDRPLTMIRMPEGITGERFYQKHWEQARPDFVQMVSVYSGHKDEKHQYIVANNLPTLLWLGQSGTLEFHVWHSRANLAADSPIKSTDYDSSEESLEGSVLNYPDYLVFDIDPYIYSGKELAGEEPEFNKKGFEGGRRVAFWLRALLKQMSLEAVVKTSGKTGLHVYVPINRTVTFDGARQITEMVGRHLLKEHPKEITMEWATQKRTGKIFIDHNMNVRGKTLRVAYSPCGSPGAPVSMPLTWDELEAADPTDFAINNVLPRLEKAGDRWHDSISSKQSLADAFESKK
jgi:bifunctional non-homologous end joining protein LigD